MRKTFLATGIAVALAVGACGTRADFSAQRPHQVATQVIEQVVGGSGAPGGVPASGSTGKAGAASRGRADAPTQLRGGSVARGGVVKIGGLFPLSGGLSAL